MHNTGDDRRRSAKLRGKDALPDRQPAAEYLDGSTAIRKTDWHDAAFNAGQTTSSNAMAAVKVATNCSRPSFVGDPSVEETHDMAVHVPTARNTRHHPVRNTRAECRAQWCKATVAARIALIN
jgi:hypothetical protein